MCDERSCEDNDFTAASFSERQEIGVTLLDLLGGSLAILGLVVSYFALKHIRIYFDRSLWRGIDRGADLMQHKAADPFNPEHMQSLQALAWWMRELSDQPKAVKSGKRLSA